MFYQPKYFKPQELVSPSFYQRWGDLSLQWIDGGLLHDLDIIRDTIKEKYGCSTVINDWSWGGSYSESGLRDNSSSYYSPTSAHSFGKAVDIKLSTWVKGDFNIQTESVIALIMSLKAEGKLKYISRIETNTNFWVHIDTFNRAPNTDKNIFTFKP